MLTSRTRCRVPSLIRTQCVAVCCSLLQRDSKSVTLTIQRFWKSLLWRICCRMTDFPHGNSIHTCYLYIYIHIFVFWMLMFKNTLWDDMEFPYANSVDTHTYIIYTCIWTFSFLNAYLLEHVVGWYRGPICQFHTHMHVHYIHMHRIFFQFECLPLRTRCRVI